MTDRQRKFIDLYMADRTPTFGNATRSAAGAGYAWPGKQGPMLARHPALAPEIERRFQIILKAAQTEWTWGT